MQVKITADLSNADVEHAYKEMERAKTLYTNAVKDLHDAITRADEIRIKQNPYYENQENKDVEERMINNLAIKIKDAFADHTP